MGDVGEELEGDVSAGGVAGDDDIGGGFMPDVDGVGEEGGGLLELAGVRGCGCEVYAGCIRDI